MAVTTQAAERIYRSTGPFSEIDVRLEVADRARQTRLGTAGDDTFLRRTPPTPHRGRRCHRARVLLFAEVTVFGRIASGEVMDRRALHDIWRVRRDGRLIFAESNRLDDVSRRLLRGPPILRPRRRLRLLLYVDAGAEARLPSVREVLEGCRAERGPAPGTACLSCDAWRAAPEDMRHDVMRAIAGYSRARRCRASGRC